MIARIAAAVGVLMTSTVLAEPELFQKCSEALKDPAYDRLQAFMDRTGESGTYCQRLTDREFVYATDENFLYCDFDANDSCAPEELGRWYPNLARGRSFTGPNSKRFVIFETQQLSGGVYGSGVQVFYLTPKTRNPHGFEVQSLQDVGEYNGLMSDGGGVCSNLGADAIASEIRGDKYEVAAEGTEGVELHFRQKLTNCGTMESQQRELRFIWDGSTFIRKEKQVR